MSGEGAAAAFPEGLVPSDDTSSPDPLQRPSLTPRQSPSSAPDTSVAGTRSELASDGEQIFHTPEPPTDPEALQLCDDERPEDGAADAVAVPDAEITGARASPATDAATAPSEVDERPVPAAQLAEFKAQEAAGGSVAGCQTPADRSPVMVVAETADHGIGEKDARMIGARQNSSKASTPVAPVQRPASAPATTSPAGVHLLACATRRCSSLSVQVTMPSCMATIVLYLVMLVSEVSCVPVAFSVALHEP